MKYSLILIGLFVMISGYFLVNKFRAVETVQQPEEEPFTMYSPPVIPVKPTYKLFLLGDSMTVALGSYGGKFNETLNNLYEQNNKFVDIYNYARSSTNVLSLDEAITTKQTIFNETFDPLIRQDFDLLLVESFGYNPLSQLSREEGLKRQREELTKFMTTITRTHPNAAVIFFTTIAPNRKNYARVTLRGLSSEDRTLQAEERIAFMQNHIAFASEYNIPVINIYEKSLLNGDGNLAYINRDDYIHPSAVGINFISDELARYIYESGILPL